MFNDKDLKLVKLIDNKRHCRALKHTYYILSSFCDRAGDTALEYVPLGFVKSPESLSFTIPLPPKLDHKLRTLSFPEIRT